MRKKDQTEDSVPIACNKGFMFYYSFSKQGLSYLKWMREMKPLEDVSYSLLTYDVMSSLSEDLKKRIGVVLSLRATYKYRGPVRNLRLFDNDSSVIAKLVLQNRELATSNRSLEIACITLSFLHSQNVCQAEQEKKVLNQNWAATLVEAARIKNENDELKKQVQFYRLSFDAAVKTIFDMGKSRQEQFKELKQFLSISDWLSRNQRQGIVPGEELGEFLQSLGLDSIETVMHLMKQGVLSDGSDGKLHIGSAQQHPE